MKHKSGNCRQKITGNSNAFPPFSPITGSVLQYGTKMLKEPVAYWEAVEPVKLEKNVEIE
jgi:hypothetical protein